MRETINRSAVEVAVGSQDTKNSRGFNVGSRIQVKADAKLPKKLSYARCCTGVVARIERLITVQLDPTQNFEAHCILVKLECLEHWPGQTSVAESVPVSSTPDACTHNLTSSPPATPTTIAKISCSSDTQEQSAFETCGCGHQLAKAYQQLSLLPPVPLVSQPELSSSQSKDIDLSSLFLLEMKFSPTKEGGEKSSQQASETTFSCEPSKLEAFLVWLQPTNTPSMSDGSPHNDEKDLMGSGNTTESSASQYGSMPKTSQKTAVWVKFYQKNDSPIEALIFGGLLEDIWLMDGEAQENSVQGQDTELEFAVRTTKLTILRSESSDASTHTESTKELLSSLKSTATNSVTFWKNSAPELEEKPSQENCYRLTKSLPVHCLRGGHQVMDTLSKSEMIAGVSESQQSANLWLWEWLYLPKEHTESWHQSENAKCQKEKLLKKERSTNKTSGLSRFPKITVQPLSKVITDGSKLEATSALASELSTTLESLKTSLTLQMEQLSTTVSPSPFRESDWALRTNETVSQPLLERSPTQPLDSSALRTSPDSSVVPSDQERELGHISLLSSVKWPFSGTMSNGFVSRADTLPPPGVGKDCSWLGSHGALSHTSRAPGLSKSESSSRAKGILGKGEVYNPDWLELSSSLPLGYSSPSESKTATQLREGDEKPSVTPSTPEWQTSPFVESCTCPSCAQPLLRLEDGCGVCGWLLQERKRSPNKKPATGSLTRNVALKKGKEYSTWQYSYSVRAPETKKGWRL
jgi:hypothetical protein